MAVVPARVVCGVVWCGVVWCGVVWCGVVWCGVVWCGVVWCGVVWCGVVWCGVVWCGVVSAGDGDSLVGCGKVWNGAVSGSGGSDPVQQSDLGGWNITCSIQAQTQGGSSGGGGGRGGAGGGGGVLFPADSMNCLLDHYAPGAFYCALIHAVPAAATLVCQGFGTNLCCKLRPACLAACCPACLAACCLPAPRTQGNGWAGLCPAPRGPRLLQRNARAI